jgi:hypothetical protein
MTLVEVGEDFSVFSIRMKKISNKAQGSKT